ncbi:MAG TPA: hypothetical protein VF734_14895 [Pseudonocardiaceae bacterium]
MHEADGLRVWDGDGTVPLIDMLVAGQSSVLASLLNRLWIEPR